MAGKQQPGNGLWADWILGESGYKTQMDSNLRFLSAAVQLVLDQSTGALPASPTNGMLVATTGSADIQARIDGAWVVVATAKKGWLGFDKARDSKVEFDGTEWVLLTTGGGGGGGLPDAPVDGKLYGRQDAAWTEVPAGTGGNTDHFLVASVYAQTSFASGVSSSGYAMKGSTIYVTSRCKLAALFIDIDFEVETARYFIQVYRVDSATHVIEEVLGVSNEVSGEGRSGVRTEEFTFGQTLELADGATYVIAVIRLDSGVSGACRVRSGINASNSVGFATIVSDKLIRDQRLSAGVGDSLVTTNGYVVMGFVYYTDVMLPPPTVGLVKTIAVAAYTPVLADAGKYLRFTSTGSSVLTVPANASEAFPIGTDIAVEQSNTGAVSLVADAGVTINVASGFGLKTGGQFGVISLKKVATDEWTLFGNLEVLE